jgi:hypothetical protein
MPRPTPFRTPRTSRPQFPAARRWCSPHSSVVEQSSFLCRCLGIPCLRPGQRIGAHHLGGHMGVCSIPHRDRSLSVVTQSASWGLCQIWMSLRAAISFFGIVGGPVGVRKRLRQEIAIALNQDTARFRLAILTLFSGRCYIFKPSLERKPRPSRSLAIPILRSDRALSLPAWPEKRALPVNLAHNGPEVP